MVDSTSTRLRQNFFAEICCGKLPLGVDVSQVYEI
jgi:hypothetical protein